MSDNILGFKFPQNRLASANRLQTNDVIEDWRHWRAPSLACSNWWGGVYYL